MLTDNSGFYFSLTGGIMSPIVALFAYLISVSVLTIILFWWDNRAHRLHKRPAPEASMLFLIAIGGTLGAWRAMSIYPHKNRKSSFRTKLGLIVICQIAALAYVAYTQIPPEFIDQLLGRPT